MIFAAATLRLRPAKVRHLTGICRICGLLLCASHHWLHYSMTDISGRERHPALGFRLSSWRANRHDMLYGHHMLVCFSIGDCISQSIATPASVVNTPRKPAQIRASWTCKSAQAAGNGCPSGYKTMILKRITSRGFGSKLISSKCSTKRDRPEIGTCRPLSGRDAACNFLRGTARRLELQQTKRSGIFRIMS